jgi:hypothetical protein
MTTFVTAFLDLGEDRSKDKSVERCFGLFSQLAGTGVSIRLFLSHSYQAEYDRIVGPHANVRIQHLNLQELDTYDDVTTVNYGLPPNRTEHHDTRNFMILMNSKIELVFRAMQQDKGAAGQYAWIDFSIFHVFRDLPGTTAYLKMLGSSKVKPGLYMPGCWDRGGEPSFASVCWRFCGGFFLGDTASLEKFYLSSRSLFKAVVALKGLAWEVNFWAWMEYIGHLNCDWFKADHNDSIVRIPGTAFRVVASLTTIPPRAAACRLALDSLIPQVEHVYLSVARDYKRFGAWEPPAYLQEEPYRSSVTVVVGEDKGPATKYVGALAVIPDNHWVFVCDDDQEYHHTLLLRMKDSIRRTCVYQNHYDSILQKTSGGLIHGYVGLLVHGSLLQGLRDFPLPEAAYFVDDQWMSIYCFLNGIDIYGTKAEHYISIFGALDGWHEKIGEASLAGLHNRDAMVAALATEFGVTFQGGNIRKI